MTETLVFGYGSLLSLESLRASVPNAKHLLPAYVKGFRRDFSLLDSEGWVSTNLDVAGVPFCAVDVHESENGEDVVNGVVFGVDGPDLPALLKRERDYELIETIAYGFHTDEPLGSCFVFAAGKHNGQYDFHSEAQARYLEICLDGARDHGDAFYETFLRTTYIGELPVCDVPSLRIKHGSKATLKDRFKKMSLPVATR
jgi:cation transport regulator ChaC